MQAVHHLHGAASGGNPHNFENGGIGGTLVTVCAWFLGWIEHSSFLQEIVQAAVVAGVGSAVSFSVSYLLNRKLRK